MQHAGSAPRRGRMLCNATEGGGPSRAAGGVQGYTTVPAQLRTAVNWLAACRTFACMLHVCCARAWVELAPAGDMAIKSGADLAAVMTCGAEGVGQKAVLHRESTMAAVISSRAQMYVPLGAFAARPPFPTYLLCHQCDHVHIRKEGLQVVIGQDLLRGGRKFAGTHAEATVL